MVYIVFINPQDEWDYGSITDGLDYTQQLCQNKNGHEQSKISIKIQAVKF